VAGADIAAMCDMSPTEATEFSSYGSRVFRKLERGPIPTIAAVQGFALGGGCELAMACDFIYASPTARFGQPEVNLGLIPGFGGTQRLALRVGTSMAMELLLTGRMIDAAEALRIGLVNRISASAESLWSEALATAEEITSRGPLAVRMTRDLARHMQNELLDAALRRESEEFGAMFGTGDAQEGMQAFLSKRPATFEGK
jgi:enoyl-CoA hydratase